MIVPWYRPAIASLPRRGPRGFQLACFVVFFVIMLFLHALPLRWTTKKVYLLIARYLFYAAWNPPFVILLWISMIVDWYAAHGCC